MKIFVHLQLYLCKTKEKTASSKRLALKSNYFRLPLYHVITPIE